MSSCPSCSRAVFGYVRPARGELKCRDMDLYRAVYCGLCRTLRRRHGPLAPMFLNFDFTFLALLLAPGDEPFLPERGRCYANPLRKKLMYQSTPALEIAADESLILAYWKLRDGARDEGALGGLPERALSWLMYFGYQRCAQYRPEFDRAVRESLEALGRLEREQSPSIDRTADAFARLLQAAVPGTGDSAHDRGMELLLYHLGRWLYLIDARDDLEEDRARGRYNPVALRYGRAGDDDALGNTLEQSLNLARSALAMLDFGCRAPVIENVFYFGLPLVQRAVFDGSWSQMKKQRIWRDSDE